MFLFFNTETFLGEENSDCVLINLGFFFVSKSATSTDHRDSIPEEFEKKKQEVFVEKAEDCFDKMLNHINITWTGDPKIYEKE